MNKEKLIRNELSRWKDENLISGDQYAELSARYPVKDGTSLVLLFSILGSLFVGGGIILLLAWNWSILPLAGQSIISFLPMALSQVICIFVFRRKYESPAWREGAALFNVLSIYTSLALIGRIFHLPSEIDMYFMVCAFLGLPVIYIFKASSPVLVYMGSIVAAYIIMYDPSLFFTILLWAPILPFVFYKVIKQRDTPSGIYIGWIFGISLIVFSLIFLGSHHSHLDLSVSTLCIICFSVLYCLDLWFYPSVGDYKKRPFLVLSIIGMLILLEMTTVYNFDIFESEKVWDVGIVVGELILFSLPLWIRKIKDFLRLSGALIIFLFSALILCAQIFHFDDTFSWVSIFLLLYISVVFIVQGITRSSYALSNLGMFIIVLTGVIQFFSGDYSFILKGLAFIATGTGFFVVNILVKKQRRLNRENQ